MQQLTTIRRDSPLPGAALLARQTGQFGVTLVELLVVITIVGILMSIGVPSYRYVTTANRVSAEINTLLGDMQYARSEAARQGRYMTVCVAQSTSPSNPSCATSGTDTWQNGWIIFGDINSDGTVDTGDPVMRIQNAFTTSDTLVSSPATSLVTFNRDGFAHLGNATTRLTLHDSTDNHLYARCLDITQAGMMTTQTNSSDTTCQ